MPWCDPCAKYWAPNAMGTDGSCPQCHTVLATKGALRAEARGLGVPAPGEDDGEVPKAPWHFKAMMVALTIYLGYRGWQGIDWVINR